LLRPPRWSSVCLRSVRLATGNPIHVLEFDRMHPAIPRLIDLQAVDHHIAAVRAEMDSFPKRILEADHKLSGARAAVTGAKEATATSVAERKKLEFEVQQWKDRARKYRDQSGAVKTNEAFKALQHEITNAEAEVAQAEDRQLEVMMAGEEAERRVRNAEANLREDEQAINAEKKRIQSLNTDKKKELDAALAERERVIAPVPQEMRDLYERIAKRHHGTALAQARDEQCRGCGMRVLPHILQMLRDDANEEVYRCESCGLILYTLEPIPAPNSEASSGSAASASTSS
jgi:predicted  nucleic acid-binding Zn-ribbon protein